MLHIIIGEAGKVAYQVEFSLCPSKDINNTGKMEHIIGPTRLITGAFKPLFTAIHLLRFLHMQSEVTFCQSFTIYL